MNPSRAEPVGTVIVLAGGRSERFGADKLQAQIAGRSVIDHVLASVPAGLHCIVAGLTTSVDDHGFTRSDEDEPYGGPAAGIERALRSVRTPVVGVWAADMPFAGPVIFSLLTRLEQDPAEVDALVPIDDAGRMQPLAAAYRTERLRRCLVELAPVRGRSMRSLLERLTISVVPEQQFGADLLMDVDTPEDLQVARRTVSRGAAATNLQLPEGDSPVGRRSAMEDWVAAACAELGIDDAIDVETILDLARDAAHKVERPAAPVSTFLMGVAVGRGMSSQEAAARLGVLARSWPARE